MRFQCKSAEKLSTKMMENGQIDKVVGDASECV